MTNPPSAEIDSRLALARTIAKSAGQITLKYFQTDELAVDFKGDGSPLTIADRESEQHLREQIEAAFPDDSIVGEEFDDRPGTSGYGWILDPIDGTKSFISGVPLYGTMVAVEKRDPGAQGRREAIIGSVHFPGLDEGIFAARGQGAFAYAADQAPQRVHVSQRAELERCVLVTTSVQTFAEREAIPAYLKLADRFYFSRTWGDVYGYYLVARGRVDAMIDPILNVWDAAAVQPIIEEAGGRFTDWRGVSAIDHGDAIGSNGHIHDALVAALADFDLPSM